MAIAESVDLVPGQKWRLATTDGDRTSLVDIPYAMSWLAMGWVLVLRMLGRDAEMMDWTKVPERIRFEHMERKPRSDSAILAERTADLLWENRHSLKITGDTYPIDEPRSERMVELPGGIELHVESSITDGVALNHGNRYVFTIHAAGREREVSDEDATPLVHAWGAIICQSFVDAMEPGAATVERRSPHADVISETLCRYVERHSAPQQDLFFKKNVGMYEIREVELRSEWRELRNGALYRHAETPYYRHATILVTDGRIGTMCIGVDPVIAAADRRSLEAVECAIAKTVPAIPGPSVTGSPKAALMMRLLRESLEKWPDLADAKGTPIEPLLSSHMPRLIDAYVAECAVPGADRTSADAILDQGLERIGAALDEALAMQRSSHRNDLRTEVAFLVSRHPDDSLKVAGSEGEGPEGFGYTVDIHL